MKTDRLMIIGHRGARGLAHENTIPSFSEALKYGVDMIETDVQITSDNKVVLLHVINGHFKVPGGGYKRIKDLSYVQLKAISPDMLTFEEGVEFVNRRVPLMLDVKPWTDPVAVVSIVRQFLAKGWKPSDFMFNSASFKNLKIFYELMPEVERVVQGNWSGVWAAHRARIVDTDYILLDQRYIWWGYVQMVSKRYKLITYTYPWWSKEPFFNHHKAQEWAKYGLYGIVTDYPNYYYADRKK